MQIKDYFLLSYLTSRKLTQVVLSKRQKIYSRVEASCHGERNQENHCDKNLLWNIKEFQTYTFL